MELIGGDSGGANLRRLQLNGLNGADVLVPVADPNTRPVIVLITFLLGDEQVTARLDVQKNMFIDRIPDTWDAKHTRDIARTISGIVRAGR